MPGRAVAGGSAIPQKTQHFTLKVWFPDGVLRDKPCCLGSVFPRDVLCGPPVPFDQLAEARGILEMDGLHAGNIGTAELARIEKFLAYPQVFRPHFEQFAPEALVDHGIILWGVLALARDAVN